MANTFSQIHIQCIFAPKFREALISRTWSERLHTYITGIVQNHNHKMIAVNSMPDHLHMLFGMRTHQSIAQIMQAVKGDSSEWINKQKLTSGKFTWQEGYGAFSYEKIRLPELVNYIMNQEEHHRNKNFIPEYIDLLNEFEINYDERFIFKNPE